MVRNGSFRAVAIQPANADATNAEFGPFADFTDAAATAFGVLSGSTLGGEK